MVELQVKNEIGGMFEDMGVEEAEACVGAAFDRVYNEALEEVLDGRRSPFALACNIDYMKKAAELARMKGDNSSSVYIDNLVKDLLEGDN